MFTGIIQELGQVKQAQTTANALKLVIHTGFSDLQLGESIAVNGVCLTVMELCSGSDPLFYLSGETLERSNLGTITAGVIVNLERALTLSTRLSGHLVQGHVDGMAKLLKIITQGDSHELEFELPNGLDHYCIEKGSIALNGISLTINSIQHIPGSDRVTICVMIVPFTWKHTNLSTLKTGDFVNTEVDLIAKYVERSCQIYRSL
jgi:riboflavin synthase